MIELIQVIILGGLVGIISAYLGLGGGILIVPLLPAVSQLTPQEAVATSLFTIFIVVSNNCINFHRHKLVIWPIALTIGPLTAVGSFFSGKLAQNMPDIFLRTILAVLVVVVFIRAINKLRIERRLKQLEEPADEVASKLPPGSLQLKFLSGGVGVFAGLLSGISGIGSGLIVSPLLMNLNLVKNKEVSPTSNGVMIFTTFFGALAFVSFSQSLNGWQLGYLHLDKALAIAAAAFVTSYFARKKQALLPKEKRGALLTILLGFLVIKMWIEVFYLLNS